MDAQLTIQVFRGFFTGRYIFDSVLGFLHYATDGPSVRLCSNGILYGTPAQCAAAGLTATTFSPLLLYLQHAGTNGTTTTRRLFRHQQQ